MNKEQTPAEVRLLQLNKELVEKERQKEINLGSWGYADTLLAEKKGILLGMKEARASAIKEVIGIMDRLEDETGYYPLNYRLLWNKLRTKITPIEISKV